MSEIGVCKQKRYLVHKFVPFKRRKWYLPHIMWYCIAGWILASVSEVQGLRKYSASEMHRLRERVRHMFQHAYDGYLQHGAPYDELRPLSCDGIDTWGSYSLTLIDALDTLAVMGNYTEFGRVVHLLRNRSFDADINVSVFETNIRIIGGLLSAHLLSNQADLQSMGLVEPGWPCEGPLLRMAEDVAQRLLPAFDTATGMPYGTVNLRHGVPYGETSVTCTAGIGTFILEFGTLSRLTGNPVYEDVAMNALSTLYQHRSAIGLYGNHIDVQTGRWIAQDAGIGAGVDSYFEYLVKGSILLEKPELMATFLESKTAIDRYMKREDWYIWVSMSKGQLTLPVFQSLEAYWPGLLSLYGSTKEALRVLHSYQFVWQQYGFLPEFYNIPTGEAGTNRENYPLRPELIESVMYLYRATGDPFLLEVGESILESIEYSAKTACGYATIRNVLNHQKEDRMESFFLAETTKYLYMLFDPSNFLHNDGRMGNVVQITENGKSRECILGAGGYLFNTEAHPIDPMALRCCEGRHSNIFARAAKDSRTEKHEYRGDLLLERDKRKIAHAYKKESQDYLEPVATKETVFASNAEFRTESTDKMVTISLPTAAMGRDIENDGGTASGIRDKAIPSIVTVSHTKDVKAAKSAPSESNSKPYKDKTDYVTKLSLQPDDPGLSLVSADNVENKMNTGTEYSSLLDTTEAGDDQTSVVDSRKATESFSLEKDVEKDKSVTTFIKVMQRIFYSTAGQQDQTNFKFNVENFYKKLQTKRLEQEKNSSSLFSTSFTKNVQYELLTCRAQSYLQRISLMGEFY